MSPADIKVQFRLYEQGGGARNLTWDEVNHPDVIAHGSQYKDLVIVTHGYLEIVTPKIWMYDVKDGYLARGFDAVIIVDWDQGNALDYFQAVGNVRSVGMMVGRLLSAWGIHERTRAVGFSLGAHIMGEAGKYVQQVTGGQKIADCHGLDPAGPLYDGCPNDMVLDKSDCTLVQAIHTSAEFVRTLGPLNTQLGTNRKSGHCDYWINCGTSQHPCSGSSFTELLTQTATLDLKTAATSVKNMTIAVACSHNRAPEVYVSQVLQTCQLSARSCPSCGTQKDCLKDVGEDVGFKMIPDDGCDPSMDENYFVQTKLVKPGEPLC
jgi:hypothetical protein